MTEKKKILIHLWGAEEGDPPHVSEIDNVPMPFLLSKIQYAVETYYGHLMFVHLDCDLSPSYRVTVWGRPFNRPGGADRKLGWLKWE